MLEREYGRSPQSALIARASQARANSNEGPKHNQLLTKFDYLNVWAFGARVLAFGPAGSVGVDP